MDTIINIIFYIASGVSVLALIFVWLGEIKLGGRRFVWYHYVPIFLIDTALGTTVPYLVINGVISISVGENVSLYVMFIILWLVILIAANSVFPIFCRDNDDFSGLCYACVSFTGIFVAAFWMVKLIGMFV